MFGPVREKQRQNDFFGGLFDYSQHNWELKRCKNERKRERIFFFSLIEAAERHSRREEPTIVNQHWLLTQVCVLQAGYSWSKRESHLPFMSCFPSLL